MTQVAPLLVRTNAGKPLLAVVWRYGLSIAGPVAVSGAHFLASLLFLHSLGAAEFGIFSFVLVVSAFAMSITGAGLVLHEHFADPRMPAYQGWADRLLRSLTDRAIAVSESTRRFLVEDRHVPESRVRLIWNGAPLDEFAPVAPEPCPEACCACAGMVAKRAPEAMAAAASLARSCLMWISLRSLRAVGGPVRVRQAGRAKLRQSREIGPTLTLPAPSRYTRALQ